MKPLYRALRTALTSTGLDGTAIPITPDAVLFCPKAPFVPLEAKLSTRSPNALIATLSKLVVSPPKEFSGYVVRGPKKESEQPPVTVDKVCADDPINNDCVLKVTAEPWVLMATPPKSALSIAPLALRAGTVTYKNGAGSGKLGQTVFSTMAAGPAGIGTTEGWVRFKLRRLAKAPAPGISAAQAPVSGCPGCGNIMLESGTPAAKFSVIFKNPVGAVVNVPLT